MTNEDMQKAMQFILEQQVQTAVKLDLLTEKTDALAIAQDRADERWARADERWARTEESIRALLSIAEIHEREISAIGEKIGTLSETGRATDERLNALINIVERHISEGRNGKP